MSETLTRAIRRMAIDGNEPGAIAVALGCDAKMVRGIIWRLRRRRDLPPPPSVGPKALPGQILQLLEDQQPGPLSTTAIRRCLGCGLAALRKALARLSDIGAVYVNDEHHLVTLLGRQVEDDPRPPSLPMAAPIERERILHAAIRRRASACIQAGDRAGAVTLLNRAAERCRPEAAINFLVLGDLIGAGHDRYPEISEADAEQLRRSAGFLTGADVKAGLEQDAR